MRCNKTEKTHANKKQKNDRALGSDLKTKHTNCDKELLDEVVACGFWHECSAIESHTGCGLRFTEIIRLLKVGSATRYSKMNDILFPTFEPILGAIEKVPIKVRETWNPQKISRTNSAQLNKLFKKRRDLTKFFKFI